MSARSTGDQRQPLLGSCLAQLLEGHALAVQALQQLQPRGALALVLQAVEQPLGREIDLHRASLA